MSQPFVPLAVPHLVGNEWAYVKECLDTNWVSSVGPFVDRFEADFVRVMGGGRAVAVTNGTAALHLALLVAGVGPGDEVLVPSMTFIAPANAVRYCGAVPILIDSEADTWQMDAMLATEFLAGCIRRADGSVINPASGRRVAAVLPVHLLGHPVDLDPLLAKARELGLPVIEDATQGLGASYKGRALGTLGDIACFSFNGNKLLTTGGGGMIATAHDDWAVLAKHLSTQAKSDPIEYCHDAIGYNYRLTNVQAAIGCAQLEQLQPYVAAKREIARRYAEALAGIPGITVMPEANWAQSCFWMYTVLVDSMAFGMDSRALLKALNAQQIQSRPLYEPLHRSMPHRDCQMLGGSVAERLYRDGLSLPCSVGLGDAEQTRVIAAIAGLAHGG